MHKNALRAAIITIAACFSMSAHAIAEETPKHLNIPAGDLATALDALARQSGVELMYSSAQVKGLQTSGLQGEYTAESAASRLLSGTNLKLRIHESGALLIAAAPAVDTTSNVPSSPSSSLEEVTVTAQKREERLLEVPVPIAAIPAARLQETEQSDLRDYFSQVPNVTIQLGNSGAPTVAIRGITTGVFSTPTVATLIDDIPYGGNSLFASGFATPEVDPSDLARLEVLRGPQGTLYGAATLGGLLKFVTIDPSTEKFGGRVQVSGSRVAHGDDAGYALRGAVNMPVNDTLAVRLSAYRRQEGGWIDNVQTGEKDINDVEASGARMSALWRPTDTSTLKLGAIYQERRTGASAYVDPTLGDYVQSTLPGTGWMEQQLKSLSAIFRASVGRGEFTSLTGYSHNTFDDKYDYSSSFLGNVQQSFPTAQGVTLEEHVTTKKFSQELRVDVPVAERVDLLVGGFFTNENSNVPQIITAVDNQVGFIGLRSSNHPVSAFSEYSLFANARYRITDRLELQLGGRYAMIDQQLSVTFGGLLPSVEPTVTTEDRPFTYLITPKYQLTDDVMLYARIASGYRPGGPNTPASTTVLAPFNPDKTRNYELGLKGELLNGTLTLDTSVFYTGWDNVLLQFIDRSTGVPTGIYLNAETAKSQGAELSSTFRPIPSLRLAGWVAFTDAKLTESIPSTSTVYGAKGDRLPTSPRWSASLFADYDFTISTRLDGFVGASGSYVGERIGPLRGAPGGVPLPRQTLGDYTQVDLKVGVEAAGSLRATLFVNNLTDERGILRGGLGVTFPHAFYYIEPRTIGLSVSMDF
jgi:iron complex outermembrane recepter protein